MAICLFLSAALHAQPALQQYTALSGTLRIGPGAKDVLPLGERGYTLLLPEGPLLGLIVSLDDRRPDTAARALVALRAAARPAGLGILHLSSGIPIDLFHDDTGPRRADSLLRRLLQQYGKPGLPLFFLGVNLSGHRAMRYLRYQERAKRPPLNVRGIVFCDGVLDWVRMWHESDKGLRDRFAESAVFEGRLVTYLLQKFLGGTPRAREDAYLELSPYSYFDPRNRHLHLLRNLAVLAYSEPATHYWMNVKGKTVFDTNFPDMVGIVSELKRTGHADATLQLFNQPDDNTDRRNPDYTWGLVDKKVLVGWMLERCR
ncbi:hypothetical protein GCM10023184_09350 [Flaviaesturariibacter amylovorans]|uniref:Alpha/beta hydrolase n=2 Tax=Flaviaesturariibacter amylovorans TaxID=1084520 RepID=A0ABP8GEE0_9BACT